MKVIICWLFHRKWWKRVPIHDSEGELSHYEIFCDKCYLEWED